MDDIQADLAAPRLRSLDRSTGVGVVSYGMDEGMIVTFFIRPKFMEFLSEQMGHPIFQDRIMTRIIAPGNTKTVWEHETKGIDYETSIDPESGEYHTEWTKLAQCPNGDQTEPDKYPKAWAAFMQKANPSDLGWPIEEWGAVSRSMAESLKMLGIPTVEALAALTDANAANIMGGRKFRDLAKAELSEREKRKILSREQQARTVAEDQIAALKLQIEQQQATISTMQAEFAAAMNGMNVAAAPTLTNAMQQPKVRSSPARSSRRQQQMLAAARGEGPSEAA